MAIVRRVMAKGTNAAAIAARLVDELRGDGLVFALVFADWRIDPRGLAEQVHRGLAPAQTVGCTATGVIGASPGEVSAIGLYGDWLRAGIGVVPELAKSPLLRSRDGVRQAIEALGTTADALDPARHVALTLVDGSSGHEEAFCIGSAAAAARIRFVGGSLGGEVAVEGRPAIWVNGTVLDAAGAVVLLDSALPFHVIRSSHLVATDLRAVVTGASGRVISELDGQPAGARLHAMVDELVELGGEQLDDTQPSQYSLGRFVDGYPYVRSIVRLDGPLIHLATAVDVGHVLRLMRPVDLIGTTQRDLAAAARQVGGTMSALIAFSCIGRHWEAEAKHLDQALAETYAGYPTVGFQTFGEQSGMLQVNHTLTGLAIGAG